MPHCRSGCRAMHGLRQSGYRQSRRRLQSGESALKCTLQCRLCSITGYHAWLPDAYGRRPRDDCPESGAKRSPLHGAAGALMLYTPAAAACAPPARDPASDWAFWGLIAGAWICRENFRLGLPIKFARSKLPRLLLRIFQMT